MATVGAGASGVVLQESHALVAVVHVSGASLATLRPRSALVRREGRVFAFRVRDDVAAGAVRSRLRADRGFIEVASSFETGRPEIDLQLDRDRAAELGVPAIPQRQLRVGMKSLRLWDLL